MNIIFQKHYHILKTLIISVSLSLVLLFFRVFLNNSILYLFLIWNLFLAAVPYFITTYLKFKSSTSKLSFAVLFIIWLLFLPNAPYIITDLMHLKFHQFMYLWLDILIILLLAVNGLVLFVLTMLDMERLLAKFLKKRSSIKIVVFSLCFLCGFGIYIGRFLRFNSWDIIQNPNHLFKDILKFVLQPLVYKDVWLFTMIFGITLIIIYKTFKAFNTLKHN